MPRISEVNIAQTSARNTLLPTRSKMPAPIRCPRPVSVTMPMMMPAVEQAVATEITFRAAWGSAVKICLNGTWVPFRRYGTIMHSRQPISAALVMV